MPIRTAVAVLLAGCVGCAGARTAPPALEPLRGEADVKVYLLPLPRDAERLSFSVDAVTIRHEGGEVPLAVARRDHAGAASRDQRLLAAGRVPPGAYQGVSLAVTSAALRGDAPDPSRLLVEAAPVRADVGFRAAARAAVVVWVALDAGAIREGHAFAPRLSATIPPQTPPEAALYCSDAASASVSVMARRPRRVTGAVPVGADPRGIALDAPAHRAYVALSGEDQIEVVDVAAGASVGRIRLSPGDGPGELGLADRTLVVVNDRSRTVSFVDVSAMIEVGRVAIGDGPGSLLLDRSGRRAYVANRASATVTVIDVPKRAVLGTIATDPEPLRAQLGRDGDRLYVAHRGSAHLAVFAVPSLAPLARAYVGLGAAALRVDSRTDLLYLGRTDEGRVDVYEPLTLQRVDRFDLPGAPSHLAIDDAEDSLLALLPERGTIAVVDLTSRKAIAEVPAGAAPFTFAFSGERP